MSGLASANQIGEPVPERVQAIASNMLDSLEQLLLQCVSQIGVLKRGEATQPLPVQCIDIVRDTDTRDRHSQALSGTQDLGSLSSNNDQDEEEENGDESEERTRSLTIASLSRKSLGPFLRVQEPIRDSGCRSSSDEHDKRMQRRRSSIPDLSSGTFLVGFLQQAPDNDCIEPRKINGKEDNAFSIAIAAIEVLPFVPFDSLIEGEDRALFLPSLLLHSHQPLALSYDSAIFPLVSTPKLNSSN